jgi:hypothetical protein
MGPQSQRRNGRSTAVPSGTLASEPLRRTSKLAKAGIRGRADMIEVDILRHRNHAPLKANRKFNEAWTSDAGCAKPSAGQQAEVASAAAAEMETIVWKYGGVQFARQIIQKFLDKPTIRGLQTDLEELMKDAASFTSKDAQVRASILMNLRGFVEKLRSMKSTKFQREACHAAITACVPPTGEITKLRMGRTYERALGLTWRALKQCTDKRAAILIDDTPGWEHWARSPRSDKVGDLYIGRISTWLHILGTPDNDNKRMARVYSETTSEGNIIYTEHPMLQMPYTKSQLLSKLTGRLVVNGRVTDQQLHEPTTAWKEIKAAYPKMKGSVKLIIAAWCACFNKPKAGICVCPTCYKLNDMLRIYHRSHRAWHAQHRLQGDGMCDCSNGQCHPVTFNEDTGNVVTASRFRNIFMTADARVAMSASMCIPVPREPLSIPEVDVDTKQLTGAKTPFKISPRQCHELTCSDCGMHRTTKKLGLPLVQVDGVSVHACRVEATSDMVTWNEWVKVPRAQPTSEKDGDPEYQAQNLGMQTEYVPVKKTRVVFMSDLFDLIDASKHHHYKLAILGMYQKSNIVEFQVRPALGVGEDWASGTALVSTDYAAKANHPRPAEATCSHPDGTHIGVYCVRKDPVNVKADDDRCLKPSMLPRMKYLTGRLKRLEEQLVKADVELADAKLGLENARVEAAASRADDLWTVLQSLRATMAEESNHDAHRDELATAISAIEESHRWRAHSTSTCYLDMYDRRVKQATSFKTITEEAVHAAEKLVRKDCAVLTSTNITFFACAKEKGSAATHHTSLRDLVFIINRGIAPPNTKAEFFFNKQRLLGSNTDKPLPDGVVDATEPIDFGDPITRLQLIHDGCASQYEGFKAYLGDQRFTDLVRSLYKLDCDLIDIKDVANHGKGVHDVLGAQPGRAVKKWCTERVGDDSAGAHDYPAGTRGFVLAAVQALPSPRGAANPAHLGFNPHSHDQNAYVYAYYPAGAFDRAVVNAQEGYKGSSGDHFRRPVGGSGTEFNRKLLVRELPCWCDVCRVANATAESLQAYDGCLMKGEFKMPRVVQLKPKSMSATTIELAQAKLVDHCNEWCSKKDQLVVVRNGDPHNSEPFWLAKVVTPYFVTWQEVEVHSGKEWRKPGWKLVTVKWLHLQNVDASADTPSRYKLVGTPCTIQCNAVSAKATRTLLTSRAHFTYDKKVYTMTTTLHDRLTRYGDVFTDERPSA